MGIVDEAIQHLLRGKNNSSDLKMISMRLEEASQIDDFYNLGKKTLAKILKHSHQIDSETVKRIVQKLKEKKGKKALSVLYYLDCGNIGKDIIEILSPFNDFPLIRELLKVSTAQVAEEDELDAIEIDWKSECEKLRTENKEYFDIIMGTIGFGNQYGGPFAIPIGKSKAVINEMIRKSGIDAKYENGVTILHFVAESCTDAEYVRSIAKQSKDINVTDNNYNHRTPIIYALNHNPNPEVVRVLIEEGAKIKWEKSEIAESIKTYPFYYAAEHCNEDIVNIFIEKQPYERSERIFRISLENKNQKVPEVLLKAGFEFRNSLQTAIKKRCNANVLIEMVKNGAKTYDSIFNDIIYKLSSFYYDNDTLDMILRFLISNVVEINPLEGEAPLEIAIKWKDSEIAIILIENGAKVNQKNFLDAIENNMSADLIRCMIQHGADVNKRESKYDYLPIELALYKLETFQVLIENGAKLDTKALGMSLIDDVTIEEYFDGQDDIVKLLIEKGADCKGRCLYNAVRKNNVNQVRMLIDAGADVRAKDRNKKTALYYAKDDEIIKMLKEAGAK